MRKIDTQRPAMGWQFLHVDDLEVMAVRHIPDRQQREIREMLVIDCVELVLLDQIGEMRKLQRNHAFRLQQQMQTTHKVIEIRNLRQNVVADQEVGLASCADQFGGKR